MDTDLRTTTTTLNRETSISGIGQFCNAPQTVGNTRPYFREWAADYGTYIDTHRQFVGTDAESVLLQALIALLGIGERWMV